ncbi:unnamed protein product [Rhizophagus irregularis]|nr:unnamed protein product [Rhizophagus irregularis]
MENFYGSLSGNAVWGSAPAIDPIKKLVYIATGNNYEIPENGTNCITNATTPEKKSECHDPSNFLDLILTLDIEKGDVKWVYGLLIDFVQAPLLVNACFKSNDWYFTCDSKCKIWNYMGIECCHSRNNLEVLTEVMFGCATKPATFGDAIVAIDILEILWQTANPTQAGGWAPVSYSNGVV